LPGTGSALCSRQKACVGGATADPDRREGGAIRNRHSLVVGSVIFAILILRISLPGADPAEGATLQATAFTGAAAGILVTIIAIRMRWPVAGANAALLAPVLILTAFLLVVEDATSRGAGSQVIGRVMDAVRNAVESGSLRVEDLVIFAAAFWTIAAFFVHATIEGSPRIAILAPLVAALAVTVIDPVEASAMRVAADVVLVAAVLVAAALDERSMQRGRFRSTAAPGSRDRRWVPFPVIASGFAVIATATALALTPALSALNMDRAGFPVPGGGSGLGSGGFNHFVDIHETLTELSTTALFTVSYDQIDDTDSRLRLLTLPRFDGDGFFTGDPGEDTFGSRRVRHEVTILRPFDASWLPAVPGARWVEPASATIGGGGVAGAQSTGLTYRVASLPLEPGEAPASPSSSLPPRDTRASDGVADLDVIRAEAERISAGSGGPLAAAIAIERHLRSRTYRLPDAPGSVDLTDWLLDDDASGYCEQFSVAMGVLTRAIGIPSRVVVGFLPGTALGRTVTVTGAEAHAWVEVWIDGLGWLPFDPTPGARSGDPFGTSYEDLVVATAELPQSQLPPAVTPTTLPATAGGPPFGLVVAVAVVAAAGVVLVAARRRARRATVRRAEAGDVVAAWDAIVLRLTEIGMAPSPSATPHEIARSTTTAMSGLATGYTKQTYGTALLDPVETEIAIDSMRRTDAELRAATPRFRRVVAASGLSPVRRRLRRR
jgi:transglutaminase-like putative cysteine protease